MKPQLLSMLIDRAGNARDTEAAAAFAADRKADDSKQTLERLQRFQIDFLQRAPGPDHAPVNAHVLNSRQEFAAALNGVVEVQRSAVEQSQEAARRAREQLLERQRRLMALQALHQKQQATALRLQVRKEQKESDAWAARRHAANGGGKA